MLLVGFLHGVWHLPLMLTTDYYTQHGNPLLVVPLFPPGSYPCRRVLWFPQAVDRKRLARNHCPRLNMAWEVMTEMTQTKLFVLEYVGGGGVIMIVGLAIFSFFVIRHMSSGSSSRSGTHPSIRSSIASQSGAAISAPPKRSTCGYWWAR